MALLSRALREARGILADDHALTPPIKVEQIAERYAHVVKQALPDDISGVLVPLDPPVRGKSWAILVHQDQAEVRQRFTIAHELGHLLLHGYSSPHADKTFRLRDTRSSDGSVREEIEANRFAAELLMPEKVILAWIEKVGLEYAPNSEEDEQQKLKKLAKTFKVSQQALSIRVANLAGRFLA
jgi:hypothetical protein